MKRELRPDDASRARTVACAPLPDPEWEPLRDFWAGAAHGELRIPRCRACAAWCWYPRERCRACGAAELAWTVTSGRGTLFSFAVVRRALHAPFAPLVPYATGLVALAEDPAVRLVTRLVDCDPEELRIDLPLHAVFRPLAFPGAERAPIVPFFTPTREPAARSTR
jgi:uncharacterized OB-fold protein